MDRLSTWHPATVPGTVHTDLLTNDLIPDPFWRDTEMALQWVGEEDWVYRTTFQLQPRFLEREVVELVFHGLDTYAEVRLNDRTILEADNMFRSWTVDVKEVLRSGENTLEIHFRSPLPPALEARAALPYALPAGNDRGDPPSRVFVRKAAYHYGWDWGPRFVTSGIWRPVELVAWSAGRITDLHVSTDSISPEAAISHGIGGASSSPGGGRPPAAGGGVPATVRVFSPDGAFEPIDQELLVEPGTNRLEVGILIPDPELWWPNGLGEATALLRARRRWMPAGGPTPSVPGSAFGSWSW